MILGVAPLAKAKSQKARSGATPRSNNAAHRATIKQQSVSEQIKSSRVDDLTLFARLFVRNVSELRAHVRFARSSNPSHEGANQMAQASRTLSPKRVLEKLRQHRACVLTLAHQSAQKTVRAQLRAQGVKLHDVSYRDLRIQAEEYIDAHRDELIAEAEHVIATSPYFVRWRIPVFEKIQVIEHSPNAEGAIAGQIAND
jgi:hypothetical protein